MTAKEYLQRPKQIVQEIRRKQGRIETLKRLATRLGPEMSDIRVQTTPDPARIQGFLAEAADEEREIARLPNEEMARILERRYLDEWTWEEIIEEMDISRTQVYERHRIALDLLTPAPEAEEENRQ